jgi:F-type H+-transporting ATPase subunit b
MLIDWFTVSAQIVNFLILVWLLKRFLYKPILRAIEERETLIKQQITKAESAKAEAEKARTSFDQKNDEFEKRREALFAEVEGEARTQRLKLLEEARKEYEISRAKLKEALKSEQAALNREIVRRTQAEVFAIARKTLTDLASSTLEERMVDVFILRLRALTQKYVGHNHGSIK